MSPQDTKNLLNSHGYYYSGDKGQNGLNYSSKNGNSFDIWHGTWWNNKTGETGNILTLEEQLKKFPGTPGI